MVELAQIPIAVLGVAAIHLSASRGRRARMWAGVLGLCAQPFWAWTTIAHGQYAITCLCLVYAAGWARAIRNNRGV